MADFLRGAPGSDGIISCSFARDPGEEPESWKDPGRRDSLSKVNSDEWFNCRITYWALLPTIALGML